MTTTEFLSNIKTELEEKLNKYPCEYSCSACQNNLFYLKTTKKVDCRFSQCPDLCLMISSRFYSGVNPHINFFIKNQIGTCDTCFRLDLCHMNQCNYQMNIIHNTIQNNLRKTESFHILKENNIIFNDINKRSKDYVFNMNLILSNLNNMNTILKKYIFLWNKSIRIKNIYLKIFSILTKSNIDFLNSGNYKKDLISNNDSSADLQNIIIQMDQKFKNMIAKYSNKLEQNKILFSPNKVYDSNSILKYEKTLNDYISLNQDLFSITSEIFNISDSIKSDIFHNRNFIKAIKIEFSKNLKYKNILTKLGLFDENELFVDNFENKINTFSQNLNSFSMLNSNLNNKNLATSKGHKILKVSLNNKSMNKKVDLEENEFEEFNKKNNPVSFKTYFQKIQKSKKNKRNINDRKENDSIKLSSEKNKNTQRGNEQRDYKEVLPGDSDLRSINYDDEEDIKDELIPSDQEKENKKIHINRKENKKSNPEKTTKDKKLFKDTNSKDSPKSRKTLSSNLLYLEDKEKERKYRNDRQKLPENEIVNKTKKLDKINKKMKENQEGELDDYGDKREKKEYRKNSFKEEINKKNDVVKDKKLEKKVKKLLEKLKELDKKYKDLSKKGLSSNKISSDKFNKTDFILKMPLLPMTNEKQFLNKTIPEVKESDLDMLNKKRKMLIYRKSTIDQEVKNSNNTNEILNNKYLSINNFTSYKKDIFQKVNISKKIPEEDVFRNKKKSSEDTINILNKDKNNFNRTKYVEKGEEITDDFSSSSLIKLPSETVKASTVNKSPFSSDSGYLDHHIYFMNGETKRDNKKHSNLKNLEKLLIKKLEDIKNVENILLNLNEKYEKGLTKLSKENIKKNNDDDRVADDNSQEASEEGNYKYSKLNSYEDDFKEKLQTKEDNLKIYDNEINNILKNILETNDMKIDKDVNENKSNIGNKITADFNNNSVFPLLFIQKSMKKLDKDLQNLEYKVRPELNIKL